MQKLITIIYSAFLILNAEFAYSQQITWQKTIGGSSYDALRTIKQTADGGYIIGGSSISNISGDKTENNLDTTGQVFSYDYWIVKISPFGNVEWDNRIDDGN